MTTTLSLPKLTDEYKREQQERVLNAEVAYEWQCYLKAKYKMLPTSIIFLVSSGVTALAIYDSPDFLFFGLFFVMVGTAATHFLYQADFEYHGQITPKGVIIRKTESIPEVFYAATRYLAYIGIVVCLVAGVMMGPMIFAGAGAFALLAFKMTGFQKNAEVRVDPFLHKIPYEVRRTGDYYQNDIRQFVCQNQMLMHTGNPEDDDLRHFHWITINCTDEQYVEIKHHLAKFITFEEVK